MRGLTNQFLRDALEEAHALQIDLAGVNIRDYSRSRHLQRITERSIEIIGEALRRALDEEPALLHENVLLRDWVNLRNVISHQYDSLIVEVIWEASTRELVTLMSEIERLLAESS